jgi:glutathione synthase/RimK-type ligase-like ATP-grasp enzyme
VIVVWGVKNDPVLAVVAASLADRPAVFKFLDQRHPTSDFRFDFGSGRNGATAGQVDGVDLTDVTAVYLRPHAADAVIEAQGWDQQSIEAVNVRRFTEGFLAWTEVTPALVINRLSAQASNTSKPGQLALIAGQGFDVPATIVTTDPDVARRFLRAHPRAITKSVSGLRSIVQRLDDLGMSRLDDVRHCPTQFQAYVPGTDYRIHVVGNQVLATMIHSDDDDYRYDRSAQRCQVAIPDLLADRCRGLARRLGLAVAGIDLRRTPDGQWICFEVNPSPGFVYFDDGAIAAAVADLLESSRVCSPNRPGRPCT